MQFDDFQIVSSSHDDTILIWDFLEVDDSTPMNSNMDVEAAIASNRAKARSSSPSSDHSPPPPSNNHRRDPNSSNKMEK